MEKQRNLEEMNTLTLKRKLPAPHTAPVGQGTATPWHSLTAEAVLSELDVETQGLTAAEAAARLGRSGRNEIARRKPVSPLRLLLKQFANFFVLMLLFAAGLAYAVSFLPGESSRRLTAFFILGIIAISVLLGFFEEYVPSRRWRPWTSCWSSKRWSCVMARGGRWTRPRWSPAISWCWRKGRKRRPTPG